MENKMKRDKNGYIHINGKSFDEFVRLNMKYYKTGDADYLDALYEAKKECFGEKHLFDSLPSMCMQVIDAYIGYGHNYTKASMPRILSLASFCGFKVDY